MNLPILVMGALALAPGSMASGASTSGTHDVAPSDLLPPADLRAQAADTLHLADLQALAVAADARSARLPLEREASALRSDNLGVGRLPQFQFRADAAYQSEVINIPIENPNFALPAPPKERYEVALDTDWTLWDGGVISAQQAIEEARLSATLAGLDAEILGTRAAVSDAFFSALLVQEQVRQVEVLLEDLGTRLTELRARVETGVALPGDTSSLRAEQLTAEQRRDALASERRVALDVLSQLTGRTVGDTDVLALPNLSNEMDGYSTDRSPVAVSLAEELRVHPQFSAFDALRATADRRADAISASAKPAISAFGQLSYGSPGFDQFNDSLHDYWRAGVRVRWAPWTWNRRDREIQEIRVQQRVIDTQEQRFSDELLRILQRPLRTVEYMRTALQSDDAIIALREDAEQFARFQFEERAISVSAYTDARSKLQDARIAQLRHRIELARAQAQYLITLGVELR